MTTMRREVRRSANKKNKKKIMTVTSLRLELARGEGAMRGRRMVTNVARGGEAERREGRGDVVVVVVVGVSTAVTWFFPKQQVPSN